MIAIRVLWSSDDEEEKALKLARELAEKLNGKMSKVYPNHRGKGGRIYINL